MNGLKLVSLHDTLLAEALERGLFDEELSHEDDKGADAVVAGVVDDIEVFKVWPLEDLKGLIK